MFYNYESRMSEIDRISRIPYPGVLERALKKFISDEEQLLRRANNGLMRSQALSYAKRLLSGFEPRVEEDVPAHKRLFF